MTPPGFELRVFHTRGGFLKHWTSRWSMAIAVKHGKREREGGGGGREEGRGRRNSSVGNCLSLAVLRDAALRFDLIGTV